VTPRPAARRSYGCMSGKAPLFPWAQWVFKDLQVRGFNLRRWMTSNKKKARRRPDAHACGTRACSARV
jgi:hypothetical protein